MPGEPYGRKSCFLVLRPYTLPTIFQGHAPMKIRFNREYPFLLSEQLTAAESAVQEAAHPINTYEGTHATFMR